MFSEKQLRATAAELNEVLGVDPAINVKGKIGVLTEQVTEALELIDTESDKFSDETMSVIKELKPDLYPTEEVEEVEEEVEEVSVKKVARKAAKEEVEEVEEVAAPAKKKTAGKGVPANFKKEGSFAEFLDGRVKEGGTWVEILADAQEDAEKRGKKTSIGTIKGHVKFRISKDAKFLGKLEVTDDGIE